MMLTTVIFKAKNDPDFQPYWNASGESTTYDWTIEELQQLNDEIESFVRPLVDKQQDLEVVIKNAETLEDLEMIDITFE